MDPEFRYYFVSSEVATHLKNAQLSRCPRAKQIKNLVIRNFTLFPSTVRFSAYQFPGCASAVAACAASEAEVVPCAAPAGACAGSVAGACGIAVYTALTFPNEARVFDPACHRLWAI